MTDSVQRIVDAFADELTALPEEEKTAIATAYLRDLRGRRQQPEREQTEGDARYELRFFFDVGVDTCLWTANEAARERFGYPVDLTALPLRPATVDRLTALARRYDESVDWKDPNTDLQPWSEQDYATFHRRARTALWTLRLELGGEYVVRDEYTDRRDGPTDPCMGR